MCRGRSRRGAAARACDPSDNNLNTCRGEATKQAVLSRWVVSCTCSVHFARYLPRTITAKAHAHDWCVLRLTPRHIPARRFHWAWLLAATTIRATGGGRCTQPNQAVAQAGQIRPNSCLPAPSMAHAPHAPQAHACTAMATYFCGHSLVKNMSTPRNSGALVADTSACTSSLV